MVSWLRRLGNVVARADLSPWQTSCLQVIRHKVWSDLKRVLLRMFWVA